MAVAAEERSQMVNELLDRIGKTVGQRAQAGTIFGDAVEREGITVIPVAKARFGFGGGAIVSPIGYIELRDGESRFKRISTPRDLLALVLSASIVGVALRRLLA